MLEKIIEIAKEAGGEIARFYKGNFAIEFKTNKSDLVTAADKASEKKIIELIEKDFPEHNILTEEREFVNKHSDYTWVIDPLDGTTNFAHGLPIFSVSIGVTRGNETLFGTVYDVTRDKVYYAEKGAGAFENGKQLRVSSNGDLEQSLLVTGFPYNIRQNPMHAIERFNAFLFESRAVRRLGSAALDFCYVASGIFDGFWEVSLNPWDICAGKLIVEEAGGKVTNFNGEEIDIYSKPILATNGIVHEKMVRILQRFND